MARYVLASRRAGKFLESQKEPARAAAENALNFLSSSIDVVGQLDPVDPLARQVSVFDADPGDIQAQAAHFGPDVILEEEILHYPAAVVRPLDLGLSAAPVATAVLAGAGRDLHLRVVDQAGAALANATIHLALRAPNQSSELIGVTDAGGQAAFTFSPFWTPAAAVVVPAGDHWVMVFRGPTDGDELPCPPLPATGPTAWWHNVLGVSQQGGGAGIRVGVADTGAGPHPSLTHVTRIGAFIDGSHDQDPDSALDVDSHGTHVCGTIGSRPVNPDDPIGVANGVDLFAARIFPGPETGANQGDIANAIDDLSRTHAADLINLSIGSRQPSEIERDAIQDALERGTICVCAAGNSAGPVEFPGAFDQSVAIAALGLEGWGPPGSLAAGRLPTLPERFGSDGLYIANFSCFGDEIDAAAPGVGIIASVPERFGLTGPLGVMDGTSMASPAACAALASALAKDEVYVSLPRDTTRSSRARTVLAQVSKHVGLARKYEGAGVPQA